MPRAAFADLQYQTTGEDVYRVASAGTMSRVSYAGTERLSVRSSGKNLRFEARADYTRDGPDGKSRGNAAFVQVLLPNGSFENRDDGDPDFLTVLNQPFAVRLDAATLRDLRVLHGSVPFSATSPLGGQTILRGYLRPGTNGPIGGRPTVAVRFEADGPMNGDLPGHTDATVTGTMRMDGTAYYALHGATLLALTVTLTLDARLTPGHGSTAMPVTIIYRRSMRATAKTPPPVPLATGGGTAARATP